jgi:D-alanyl-lipoteichoic acid acyltransferase DltB (MBOAT superfamily)
MLFNSLHYLIYLPIVVGSYFLCPHRWRWLLLLLASYYFYMCWSADYAVKVEYALLLLVSTSVAYTAGRGIAGAEDPRRKKLFLWSSICVLLGILFTFKYYNFANDSLRGVFAALQIPFTIPYSQLLLPIGISFYTFQKISYVVDVYHGQAKVEKHFGVFAVYSCFFPQLVAGPIERPRHLLHQFYERHEFSYDNAVAGLKQILWGVFKKVVVADRVAILVQAVYHDPRGYSGLPLIVATVFYAVQIYCDFSGYTDIALGSARLIGFDLMANFRQPYFSKSIPEFWRRWHISLSTWFKDYLYIPLGGNRVAKWRWYYNLFITFFISGLWHGASWTFAAWGALHGGYMVLDSFFGRGRDWFRGRLKNIFAQTAFDWLNVALTFALVTVAWIPFRAANFSDAGYIFTHLFAGASHWLDLGAVSIQFRGMGLNSTEFMFAVIFIGVVVAYDLIDSRAGVWESLRTQPLPVRWAVYYALLILVLFFAPYNQAQNFIYFQF